MTGPDTAQHAPALGRSLLLQAGGFGLGLAVHMLLSRWLGAEDYGDLSATLSVALLGATLAVLGFDRAASQTLPRYAAEGEGSLAASFTRQALATVAVGALTAALVIWFGTRLVEHAFNVDQHPIRHAALLILPMAWVMLLGSLLTGLRRPLASAILGQVTTRSLMLALAAWVVLASMPASEHLAVALVAAAWALAAVLLGVVIWRNWPTGWTAGSAQSPGQTTTWRRTARAFLLATLPLVGLEESGILLMELFHADEAAVGIYAAAHRTAGLPLIALTAARQLAVPDLAAARSAGLPAFEASLRSYLRFVVALGALIWLAFVVLGDELLALFGNSSEQGHVILVLLGAGYVTFLASGLAAPVLQLHGEHRLVIGSMVALLVLALVSGAVVTPVWGGEGLAASFALASLLVLGHMIRQVHRRTGVRYLGLLLSRR